MNNNRNMLEIVVFENSHEFKFDYFGIKSEPYGH